MQIATQQLQNLRNVKTNEIKILKNKNIDASKLINEVKDINGDLKILKEKLSVLLKEIENIVCIIPNTPHQSVPFGMDSSDNIEMYRWGTPPEFNFKIKDHVELGNLTKQIDSELAAKMSGSRFTILRGNLAKLHRALAQFMLDLHINEHGYEEVNVPLLVNEQSLYGTGQLPKFKDDLFRINEEKFLIPTSEVPLTNIVSNTLLNSTELPLRFVAHSLCFRAEAGSAGKDTKGIIRQHQFEKVELVSITTEQESENEHERMTQCAENVLKLLKLPYRKVLLCTNDMGFSANKTYDIEVWIPSQNTYREISSCSNCGDFQARRMNAKVNNIECAKNQYVHTLNGSGVAVGRALVAVMENYQNSDGSITVPEILHSYMGNVKVIN